MPHLCLCPELGGHQSPFQVLHAEALASANILQYKQGRRDDLTRTHAQAYGTLQCLSSDTGQVGLCTGVGEGLYPFSMFIGQPGHVHQLSNLQSPGKPSCLPRGQIELIAPPPSLTPSPQLPGSVASSHFPWKLMSAIWGM